MRRRLTIASLLAVSLIAVPGASAEATPAGCARGPLAEAARTLVGRGVEIAGIGTVAGFRSALVLEPVVYPGVRHRLIRSGDLWCNAGGFNAAWREAGRPRDAVAMASAYVQIAPANFFDGITVSSARQTAPGVVALSTHAVTNGITARWVVRVDGRGIQRATWTTTGLAVAPFEAQWEGVSALPGLSRTYVRSGAGSLEVTRELFSELSMADPGPFTEGTTADDFTLRLSFGDTHVSPTPGLDTGTPVDRPRNIMRMLLANYQEFYDWGLRKGWIGAPWGQDLLEDTGYVYFDDAISAYCWACVFIREDFQIHMSSAVEQILLALGWEYPDSDDALANVLGHEMVHNFQNAYYKPTQGGATTSSSFSEGTARFQESLHSYSQVSHQPKSLVYSTGREFPGGIVSLAANSCNGWDGANIENAFAGGPFTGKSYNACYFWLSWYPQHGTTGIVDLFTAMRDHASKAGHQEVIDALEQVGDFADDLAAFAQASITGKGYTWVAPGVTEPELDWGQYLDRWSPPMLNGTQFSKTISNGGVTAREIDGGGVVSWSGAEGTALYLIRDDGTTATRTKLAQGEGIPAPAEGERAWLVGVYPRTGSSQVTVELS